MNVSNKIEKSTIILVRGPAERVLKMTFKVLIIPGIVCPSCCNSNLLQGHLHPTKGVYYVRQMKQFTTDTQHVDHWNTYIYFLPSEMKWVWGRDLFSDFTFNFYLDANLVSPVKGLDMDYGTVSWMRRKYPQMYSWTPDLSKVTWCSFNNEAYKGNDTKNNIHGLHLQIAK